MAKIINYATPFNEENLNGGFYVVFVSDNNRIDGFMAQWGEEINIIDIIPVKIGYDFTGWKCADCENTVSSGSTFIVTKETIFIAQFIQACTHNYINGVCAKCGHECMHANFDNGVCTECNYQHSPHNFTHSYSQIQNSDTQHIAYCTCGASKPEDHDYDNGVCTACGYVCQHTNYINGKCATCNCEHLPHNYTHTYAQYSSSKHRAYCICGASQLEFHTFVEAINELGDKYKGCTKCNYSETIKHTCSYTSYYTQHTNTHHKAHCICGAYEIKSHSFDMTGKCVDCGYICSHTYSNGVCTICDRAHSPHNFTYSYSQNDSYSHLAYCSCGASSVESHTYNSANTCTKCGYHMHSYTYSYSQNSNTKHRAYCICGASQLESHTFVQSVNELGDIYKGCTKCGYYETTPHTCSYTSYYSHNSNTQHKAHCQCGAYTLQAHTYNSSGVCTKCGYTCTHTYSNGVCTTCGYACTSHSYTNSYSKYTDTQHIAYCKCGKFIYETHTFKLDKCTKCGHDARIGLF